MERSEIQKKYFDMHTIPKQQKMACFHILSIPTKKNIKLKITFFLKIYMAQDSLKKRNQSATSQSNEEKDGRKHHYLFTIDEIKLETKNLKLDQRFFLLFGIMWFLFVIVILADLDYNRNKEIDQFKSKGESLHND